MKAIRVPVGLKESPAPDYLTLAVDARGPKLSAHRGLRLERLQPHYHDTDVIVAITTACKTELVAGLVHHVDHPQQISVVHFGEAGFKDVVMPWLLKRGHQVFPEPVVFADLPRREYGLPCPACGLRWRQVEDYRFTVDCNIRNIRWCCVAWVST